MSAPLGNASGKPWYREIWPWLLMLPPAFSVAGGVIMVYLASHTPSALVVEDYARIDALTTERFERDRRAAELGVQATLSFASMPGRIEARLTAPAMFAQPRTLRLSARHATNPAADRELTLVPEGGLYAATAELLPGHYRIELMPDDRSWRLGREAIRLAGTLELRPQATAAARD